jgi:hypothetical protein
MTKRHEKISGDDVVGSVDGDGDGTRQEDDANFGHPTFGQLVLYLRPERKETKDFLGIDRGVGRLLF